MNKETQGAQSSPSDDMKQNKAFLWLTKLVFDTVIYTALYDFKAVHGAEKLPKDGAAVVATNHAYWVDPFTTAYLLFIQNWRRPFSAPGKDSLFRYPIIKQAFEMWGTYPTDRRGNAGAMNKQLIRAFRNCMKQGYPFIYCPEGTRDPEHITAVYPGFIKKTWETNSGIPLFIESHKYGNGTVLKGIALRRELEVFIDGPFYPRDLGLEHLVGCEQKISDFVGRTFSDRTGLPYMPEYETKVTAMRNAKKRSTRAAEAM